MSDIFFLIFAMWADIIKGLCDINYKKTLINR